LCIKSLPLLLQVLVSKILSPSHFLALLDDGSVISHFLKS